MMTETSQTQPGEHQPLILERLSDFDDEEEYLAHFPDIRGRAVVNPRGDEVGMVDELYVNPRNHQVEMAEITFSEAGGYGGRRVLVPVEELQFTDGSVRILPQEEHLRLAPEFEAATPMYESYYEYWGREFIPDTEEQDEKSLRPQGRLELEGMEDEEEELEEQPSSR